MNAPRRLQQAGAAVGRNGAAAFTLLELMITSAILVVLTAVAFPLYQQTRNAALIGSLVGELTGFARACATLNASGLSETPTPPPVSPERGGVEILQGCTAANQGATLQASWGSARASGIRCLSSTSTLSSSKATFTITTDSTLSCLFED
ncbi:type II secretion system protein [Synechococcus sp. CBW1004]|uniref:type II secretion system protein n=1 Tax=Synechococcus sp. CBW1004 TaxID=1353136 RepID=UPI0018CF6654|nr:prepilin-type N-terminal cleavage/methylation domain-containing protein [Synechococcus sp. CBW1004]QPN62256.1 prepilin-type N-terminal cleavage/methylation domain-containing protein [Synechococcus sp. CBW1004]